jgi:hypothetical protein
VDSDDGNIILLGPHFDKDQFCFDLDTDDCGKASASASQTWLTMKKF